MDCQSEMDRELRIEGASYIPEPGEIVVYVLRGNSYPLCNVVTRHDGSEQGLREMNAALRTWARREFSTMSPTKSNTYYRTEEGDVGVVSADGKHIAPMDSEEGRYIQADAPGFPAPWDE